MSGFRDRAALAQMVDQLASCAVNPRLNCAKRYVHRFRDFGITQLLLVKQYKRLSVIVPQPGQGQFDFLRKLVGRLAVGRIIGNQFYVRLRHRPTVAAGQSRPATVPRNRQQPRFEVTCRIPAMQVFENPHEGFLRRVFGVLTLAEHAVTKAKNLSFEPLDKRKHSPLVAGQAPLD